MELSQYRIVLVNLDPTVGSEIKKTRPCVIISPMTINLPKYPTRVKVQHNGKQGMIALDQIRTIDKGRIVKVFQSLTGAEIRKCKAVIKETYVD